MQANIFLIITTLLIVKPTVNGLFLAKFGVEQLPFAFILVAVVAAIVSTIYSKMILRVSLYQIFRFTLVFSIAVLVVFGILLRANIGESIVLYLFYLWVAIFALVTTSQFWILANLLFDSREAKRIFGFIGAGAITGGIFGGYLTSILSNSFSSEFLTIVAAFILIPTLFITQYLWKHYVEVKSVVKTGISQAKYDSRNPVQILKSSRHLRLIAAIVGISVMVAKLVDYQFGGLASELITDPNELTAFFGFWFSTFNIISLGIQLFLTPKVVGKYGVGSSLFILPLTIMGAVSIILFFPEVLFAIVLLKLSDGGLKQSINKAAMELLIFPVPLELKNRTKTFIDVFVDSLATGLIGLVLIFFVRGLGMSYRAVSIITLFLIAIWIYLANLVRREYLTTITQKLKSISPLKKNDEALDLSNHSVLEGIDRVLQHGTEEQKIYMLRKIKNSTSQIFQPIIKSMLDDPSAIIRSEVLQNLYLHPDPQSEEKIKNLTQDAHQDVKVHAIEYLIRHTIDKAAVVNRYIIDEDLKIWGAALVGLARETRANKILANKTNLKRLIDDATQKVSKNENIEDRRFMCVVILKTIGQAHLQEYYSYIDEHLRSEDNTIMQQAVIAAGEVQSDFFFESLMLLGAKSTGDQKDLIVDALSKYGYLFLYLIAQWDSEYHNRADVRMMIPGVLKKIVHQSSVDYLFGLLSDKNYTIRREAMRGLNALRNSNTGTLKFDNGVIARQIKKTATGYMDMLKILYAQTGIQTSSEAEEQIAHQALLRLLEKRIDRRLEIMFRLVGLRYSPDDILPAYNGLISEQSELRISAMEMLDNILDKDLRKILMPIIESNVLEPISPAIVKRLNLTIPEEIDCYSYLLSHGDERVILSVLYLLKHKKQISMMADIHHMMLHPNKKISLHATELMQKYESRS